MNFDYRDVAMALRERMYSYRLRTPPGDKVLMYGQEVDAETMAKAKALAARGFPRSDAARVRRMERYIEWRVNQIKERRARRLKSLHRFALGMLAVPAFLLLLAGLWRGAIWMMLNG